MVRDILVLHLRTGRSRDRGAYGNGAYGPCRRQREERRELLEIWVRNNPTLGAKGELPDGLSFGTDAVTIRNTNQSKDYKRLKKQFRRVQARCNKDVTAEELEERHIAEQLKYAEQGLESELREEGERRRRRDEYTNAPFPRSVLHVPRI